MGLVDNDLTMRQTVLGYMVVAVVEGTGKQLTLFSFSFFMFYLVVNFGCLVYHILGTFAKMRYSVFKMDF